MKEIDKSAIEEYGIDETILMENAGLNVVLRMEREYGTFSGKIVNILCGPGNNGGDGLVIARHLINQGASVNVFLLFDAEKEEKLSKATKTNLEIIRKITNRIYRISNEKDINLYEGMIVSAHFIVDAIFGTGFRGEPQPLYADIIDIVNRAMVPVIAVDIPSGLEGDTGHASKHTIIADLTVTFALPKLGQIIVDGPKFVGKLVVADISIPRAAIQKKKIKYNLIDFDDIKFDIPMRLLDVHKGQVGKIMIIAGSRGLTGAAGLASEAALRMGAGVVTLFCPESLNTVFEQKLIEVMTYPLPDEGKGFFIEKNVNQILLEANKFDVVLLGNGLGRNEETKEFVLKLIKELKKPLVIDADGLNLLAEDTSILKEKSAPIIITPHYMEMSRLTGKDIEQIKKDPVNAAVEFAQEFGVITVLKSYRTIITDVTGEVYINTTGNPGMATAGMGDVFAGFVVSLFAQGLSPVNAAKVSAYLLGYIADYIAFSLFENSIIAGDIITFLPKALKDLIKEKIQNRG